MTQWGLDTLFNPAKRHMDEEKRRLQSTREEVGDSSGGKRIDLDSGKVTIRRGGAASDGASTEADTDTEATDETDTDTEAADQVEVETEVETEAAVETDSDDARTAAAEADDGTDEGVKAVADEATAEADGPAPEPGPTA